MIDRACISVSNACNMRCRYCHFKTRKNNKEDISSEDLRIILSNIIEYTERENIVRFKVGLVGAGESLLRFELIKEAVQYTKERSNSVSFYTITNGLNVDDDMLHFFHINRGVIKLNFSLDGPKNIHDSQRVQIDGEGSFEMVMGAIQKYEKLFGKKPEINCTVHRHTLENADLVLNFFKREGFGDVCFSRVVDVPEELQIQRAEFDDFISYADKKGIIMRQKKEHVSYDCTMYGKQCGVGVTNIFYFNGNIYPCGRFIGSEKYVLGSFNTSLEKTELIMKTMPRCAPNECFFDTFVAIEGALGIRDAVYSRGVSA